MFQNERANLRRCISDADVFGLWTGQAGVAGMDRAKGAYLIALNLTTVPELPRSLKRTAKLEPGWHLYAGSAWGGAGIRARVARHLRQDKKRHWHIDHLTLAASDITALAVPAGTECALVERLLGTGRFRIAMPGFGSSDCGGCESHLLRFDAR